MHLISAKKKQIRRCVLGVCVFIAPQSLLIAQAPPAGSNTQNSSEVLPAPLPGGTPLEDLLREAEANNPQIRGAEEAWDAAKQSPSQASSLADPQLRELPQSQAAVAQENYEAVRRSVRANLKEAYLQLFYVFETLQTLDLEGDLLTRLEQAAEARYRSGMGNQQDLLRAQLEETKYLAELSHHDLEEDKLQYRIKQILNRSPSFSNVTPVTISETTLDASYYDLLAAARGQNPDLAAAEGLVKSQELRVDLARKDLDPDFDLQYEWQLTDPTQLQADYVLRSAPRTPVSQGAKEEAAKPQPSTRQPALAQAETELLRSRSELDVASLEVADELGNQYATVQRTKDLLRIYREGLLPQARTLAEAGLAAYQDNRLEFSDVLSATLEISRLNGEYWQILADHETAIARIEEITGLSLRSGESVPATRP